MSKDKSEKAQDILLGSISETPWLLCALALSSEQRAHSWRLWQVRCPCTDTATITGIYNTQTPRVDHPLPSTNENTIAFLSQDAHSTGLSCPALLLIIINFREDWRHTVGPFQSEHGGLQKPLSITKAFPYCRTHTSRSLLFCGAAPGCLLLPLPSLYPWLSPFF